MSAVVTMRPTGAPDFGQLSVARVSYETAKKMCIENHYSHKWQATFGTSSYGIFRDDVLLGVAAYGYPMNPKSWHAITSTPPEKCIELNRLWIDDVLGANTETWLLGRSFRLLREDGYELVQTFADGRLGVGTIYQAANFSYHGHHESIFHEDTETGEVHHDLSFANTDVVSGMLRRNHMHTQRGRTKTFRVRTYRYLHPLTRGARKTLLMKQEPYPKERRGLVDIPDYTPPVGQIARCVVLCEITDDPRMEDFRRLLDAITDRPEEFITQQRGNAITLQMARDAEQAPTLWTFAGFEEQ